jgi:cysteine desulfurase/selenocysteine lyase
MIDRVSFEHTSFNSLPYKFEAGTPNIAGAIGLHAAITYLNQYDRTQLAAHEQQLFYRVFDFLHAQPLVELYSQRENNVGIISFNIKSEHHQDIGTLLDQQGIAVRTGHHCTMPLMTSLGINGTIRLSFSIYNNSDDANAFISGLSKVLDMFD